MDRLSGSRRITAPTGPTSRFLGRAAANTSRGPELTMSTRRAGRTPMHRSTAIQLRHGSRSSAYPMGSIASPAKPTVGHFGAMSGMINPHATRPVRFQSDREIANGACLFRDHLRSPLRPRVRVHGASDWTRRSRSCAGCVPDRVPGSTALSAGRWLSKAVAVRHRPERAAAVVPDPGA